MMASACVNDVGMPPESFLECPAVRPTYGWLSPRISISRGISDNEASKNEDDIPDPDSSKSKKADPEDIVDFEFQPDDPAPMLPADEIFSDGKLVPLQLALARTAKADCAAEILLPEPVKSDLYVFSPKAPSCTSRWRELLCLKKAQRSKTENQKSTDPPGSKVPNSQSLKHFLHRSTKSSSTDFSLSLPLLRDSDSDLDSIPASHSHSSSSSSGPDHQDSDRSNLVPNLLCRNPPTVRLAKARSTEVDGRIATRDRPSPIQHAPEFIALGYVPAKTGRCPARRSQVPLSEDDIAVRVGRSPLWQVSESGELPPPVDSPRLNASGKVIFQGLERSSSSPSTFKGGLRPRPFGMERSYSANIRVKPILNVPVCSLHGKAKSVPVFGFGPLLSHQKKEKAASTAKNGSCSISAHNGREVKTRSLHPEIN